MKKLIAAAVALPVVALAVFAALWTMPMNNEQAVRIHIEQGETLGQKARQWEQQGWLPSALLLRVQARLLKQEHLKAGEFDVPAGLDGTALLTFLQTAQPISYKVSLIEGTTLAEALKNIANAERLKQDVDPLTPEGVASLLGIEGNPEGWLYPDTYVYQGGSKASAVLKQSYQRMQTQLQQAWDNQAEGLPYKSAYDALIMASIVEKETAVPAERPEIAGVFVQRLKKNMRLETDPTVIYGMGDAYKGNIRKRDLLNRSNPYNTYRIKGLPPTPIALAGREALDAALNPAATKALFFVARGDGSHVFSETLEQHNKAVRQYQIRNRKSDYRSTPLKPAPEASASETESTANQASGEGQ
ncbi:endolytic transglycosylase MltG [Oceanobacter kriegii]|uniref:endolytic transglycosylase MltG n=1 Tax=Oceanobacter kriegii TaxID=64972 RepID=UPI0004011D09|nr:endolytic transglycosylase MltG [Oceanobacter kriegii]